jgi:hypothetical protein
MTNFVNEASRETQAQRLVLQKLSISTPSIVSSKGKGKGTRIRFAEADRKL